VPDDPPGSAAGMTLGDLRGELALREYLPDDLPVLVHAEDVDGNEVLAALRSMSVDATCDDHDVFRLFADQEDS
jgi:hypothetical protein